MYLLAKVYEFRDIFDILHIVNPYYAVSLLQQKSFLKTFDLKSTDAYGNSTIFDALENYELFLSSFEADADEKLFIEKGGRLEVSELYRSRELYSNFNYAFDILKRRFSQSYDMMPILQETKHEVRYEEMIAPATSVIVSRYSKECVEQFKIKVYCAHYKLENIKKDGDKSMNKPRGLKPYILTAKSVDNPAQEWKRVLEETQTGEKTSIENLIKQAEKKNQVDNNLSELIEISQTTVTQPFVPLEKVTLQNPAGKNLELEVVGDDTIIVEPLDIGSCRSCEEGLPYITFKDSNGKEYSTLEKLTSTQEFKLDNDRPLPEPTSTLEYFENYIYGLKNFQSKTYYLTSRTCARKSGPQWLTVSQYHKFETYMTLGVKITMEKYKRELKKRIGEAISIKEALKDKKNLKVNTSIKDAFSFYYEAGISIEDTKYKVKNKKFEKIAPPNNIINFINYILEFLAAAQIFLALFKKGMRNPQRLLNEEKFDEEVAKLTIASDFNFTIASSIVEAQKTPFVQRQYAFAAGASPFLKIEGEVDILYILLHLPLTIKVGATLDKLRHAKYVNFDPKILLKAKGQIDIDGLHGAMVNETKGVSDFGAGFGGKIEFSAEGKVEFNAGAAEIGIMITLGANAEVKTGIDGKLKIGLQTIGNELRPALHGDIDFLGIIVEYSVFKRISFDSNDDNKDSSQNNNSFISSFLSGFSIEDENDSKEKHVWIKPCSLFKFRSEEDREKERENQNYGLETLFEHQDKGQTWDGQ